MEKKKIDKVIEAFRNYIHLKEEMMSTSPTNNVGGGKIAGTPQADPENPPVSKKSKKYIYQKGLRKWWRQNIR
jgi:hypothetical protein